MTSLGIKHDNCPIIQCGGNGPISVVICSEETGSRTIVHAKGNLTELSLQHFETKLDINQYSWIHFEVSYTKSRLVIWYVWIVDLKT